MSTVNYNLKHKGVRLIPASKAWVKGKNGKLRLSPESMTPKDYEQAKKYAEKAKQKYLSQKCNKK